ncbi:hypothetical protein OAK75_14240, partial [Bacteriovoracales bacterium]|nr:hypothetical protein [Bacteriovoracales bacterium]
MRTKIIAIISFLFISAHANAMMFVEPSFAYTVSGKYDFTQSSTPYSWDVSGYSGSLKLGWSTAGVSIGALAKRGKSEVTDGTNTSYSWTTQYGAFIGYSLPIMLSFGVSYLLPPTQHSESTYNHLSSSHLAFGVSYSVVPFVRLQVNYAMSISPQIMVNGTGNDIPYGNVTEHSSNAITVGL